MSDNFNDQKHIWDFPEPTFINPNGFKLRQPNEQKELLLYNIYHYIKNIVSDALSHPKNFYINFYNKYKGPKTPLTFEEFLEVLELSRHYYLNNNFTVSEIPKGTKYYGLNKPKYRYIDKNAKSAGIDGNIRCQYRDIFLNLELSPKLLKETVLHELAHVHHMTYREAGNHQGDFKLLEELFKMSDNNLL